MARVPRSEGATRSRQETLLVLFTCVLASCGIVWSIWRVPLVLSNDGPQSLLISHIDARYDDPGSIFALQFSRGLGLSGRGFMFLYAPLEGLAWPTGVRVAQATMLLAFGWGAAVLSRALSGRFSYKSLLGFALAASWPFYMGFWAFSVASALGLWLLAAVVAASKPTPAIKLAISVGLLCQLLCHPVIAAVTLVAASLVVVARHVPFEPERRAALRADIAWLVLSAVPHLAVFVVMKGAQASLSQVTASEKTEWEALPRLLQIVPRLAVPGSTVLGWIAIGVALAAVAHALRRLRSEARAEVRGLTVAAAGLVAFALFGPLHMPGWQYFAPRFLAFAMVCCFALLPDFAELRARAAAGIASFSFVVLGLLDVGALNATFAAACGDALFALDQPRQRSGMVLPIVFDSRCGSPADPALAPVPYMAPALHLSALFPIRHGGSVPFVFSGPAAVHVLVPRPTDLPVPPYDLWGFTADDAEMRDPAVRATILDRLILFGGAYEAVQLFGKNDADRKQLVDRGMIVDVDRGSFLSGRLEPCSVDVLVPVYPGDPPLSVTAGLGERDLSAGKISGLDGGALARLQTVCGKQWVRVAWESGDRRCLNADRSGRIPIDVPATDRKLEVRCQTVLTGAGQP